MSGQDQRRNPRLVHHARIKVVVPVSSEAFLLEMKDFSESGLFLLCPDERIPEIGSIVEVQTTELEDAPVQSAKVVRIQQGHGFAVEFVCAASGADV